MCFKSVFAVLPLTGQSESVDRHQLLQVFYQSLGHSVQIPSPSPVFGIHFLKKEKKVRLLGQSNQKSTMMFYLYLLCICTIKMNRQDVCHVLNMYALFCKYTSWHTQTSTVWENLTVTLHTFVCSLACATGQQGCLGSEHSGSQKHNQGNQDRAAESVYLRPQIDRAAHNCWLIKNRLNPGTEQSS